MSFPTSPSLTSRTGCTFQYQQASDQTSKRLPFIPNRRSSSGQNEGHRSLPNYRINPHIEPGGDIDSPNDGLNNIPLDYTDTPARQQLSSEKVGLFKRLSSEITRSLTGTKKWDELTPPSASNSTPKSETVPSARSGLKDEATPSRFFGFLRNRKPSVCSVTSDGDKYLRSCPQDESKHFSSIVHRQGNHTLSYEQVKHQDPSKTDVKLQMDATALQEAAELKNSSWMSFKHSVTKNKENQSIEEIRQSIQVQPKSNDSSPKTSSVDVVARVSVYEENYRLPDKSARHLNILCGRPTIEANSQQPFRSRSDKVLLNPRVSSASQNEQVISRPATDDQPSLVVPSTVLSSSIVPQHHKRKESGTQQLPTLHLAPQDRHFPSIRNRKRSVDSAQSHSSSSSSTSHPSERRQHSRQVGHHKDSSGLPPLQSPNCRRVSHNSSTATSVQNQPRRNSETSGTCVSQSSSDLRETDLRVCNTERTERSLRSSHRSQSSERGERSHRSLRKSSVLKRTPLQPPLPPSLSPPSLSPPPSQQPDLHQQHLQQQQQLQSNSVNQSPCRHRRWSLSSRHDTNSENGETGHESARGLRRFTGSTIGRRNSSVASPSSLSSSSPLHIKLTPSLSWFLRFRCGDRVKHNMGAALGNCCAGRDDDTAKSKAKEKYDKTWDFLQGEQVLSDVDKFDRAYANNDIKGFVDLANSVEPIEELPEKMHPWAADPKTVGALSITQLAILAAKDDDPTIKDRIRDSGVIPILVKNLSSKEEDRLHASVVALSFLSVDNPRNCIEIFESGALVMLIKGMESDIEGLRGATAQTCRNIYVLDLKYRAEFKKHGGVAALVKLLDLPQGNVDPDSLFNQLEAVYHLEDFILEAGEELPEYVSEVKKAGAVRRLEALVKIENQDLTEAAQYLLVRLAD